MDCDSSYFLPHDKLQNLILSLQQAGYTCIGPQVRDGAIVYDHLHDADQLPWGMRDHQTPGEYRLENIQQKKAFAFSNGAQAIKPLLFKPTETVWKVARDSTGKLQFQPHRPAEKPIAIFGARSCDIAAMVIQDKVFINDQRANPQYKSRRDNLFVIAVNCSYSSNNCFCVSAGTGPKVTHSFDILMTEIKDGFTIKIGSDRGKSIMQPLNLAASNDDQNTHAENVPVIAASMQTKRIPFNNTNKLKEVLFANLEHPRWDDIAQQCLSCGNCTSVCPTCFCHSESDKQSLDGSSSEHQREWVSCFTAGHSYIHGKVIRDDTKKRYRQWLTHKVGSWFDQFNTSGCVGCGRCMTWCPVGIDLTEELAIITGESNERSQHES